MFRTVSLSRVEYSNIRVGQEATSFAIANPTEGADLRETRMLSPSEVAALVIRATELRGISTSHEGNK
jgi:hypothetical protein